MITDKVLDETECFLRHLVEQWRDGGIRILDVVSLAEDRFDEVFPSLSRSSEARATFLLELLDDVSTAHVQPLKEEDIPTIIRVLRLLPSDPVAAKAVWNDYTASIDWDDRLKELYR